MDTVLGLVNVVLIVAAALLLLPTLVLLVQVAAAIGVAPRPPSAPGRRPRLAVLVPAHDEAAGIAATLDALRLQIELGDRLVVIADNCVDDTALIAARHGAEVVVRHDALKRGKGYALDRGLQHLASDPPEVVVIVDADCWVAAGGLAALARDCLRTGRPAQALYLMTAPAGAGLKLRMAEFAWLVKNKVRALGYHRLGLPCQLTGSGMALPWPLLEGVSLASGSIVEDLQFGLDLASAGVPPEFCPEALVTSGFPTSAAGAQAQRTRWEHGHLELLLSRGLPLFWVGVRQRRWGVAAMALDLCVPPLSSLVVLLCVALVVTASFGATTGDGLAFALALVAGACLTLAVIAAWSSFGRHIVAFSELSSVPVYVVRKLPTYLRFLWRRQTEWVRTHRDDGPPGPR